ncbi:MAG: hypothetical protein M1839_000859 [Geoglossum umbratile]|nr:MAG: hypothetical protein M1839_000859 [Geoglossum umbratile]
MVSSDELLCGLDQRWAQLFSNKDESAVMRIQAAHKCCGFKTTKDRAAPFPPETETCVHKFKWGKPCRDDWRQDEQLFAGLFLLVAIAVFVVKFAGLFHFRTNVSWFDNLFNHRREEVERGPRFLPAPEEQADIESDTVRRIDRYRDEEEIGEEDIPTHRSAEGGSGTPNKPGPIVEPSGLSSRNEWATS